MGDLIYNKGIEGKACGCNEQQEIQLLRELEDERNAIVQREKDIIRFTNLIGSLRLSIFEKEQEKAKIIADYQKALKDYQTSAPEFRESQLIALKRDLERNRNSILDLQHDYTDIDDKCNTVKRALSASLPDLNQAEECLAKKDYLLKLRTQTAKYLPERSIAKLNDAKLALARALHAFSP